MAIFSLRQHESSEFKKADLRNHFRESPPLDHFFDFVRTIDAEL